MTTEIKDTKVVSTDSSSSVYYATKRMETTDRFYYETLRSTNYDTYSAINELLDNSIDAMAKHVEVIYDRDKNILIIKDDGCGMSTEKLMNSMDLGSDSTYTQNQIGYFGMGLKSSSLNLIDFEKENPIIEILTSNGDETSKLIWQPKKDVRKLDIFKLSEKMERGTTVIIHDVVSFFEAPFKKNLGVVFYPTLKNGNLKMTVNGDEIIGYDPLYRDRAKTQQNFVDATAYGETIRITTCVMDELEDRIPWDSKKEEKGSKESTWSFKKYGCYVIYGGRYIEVGGTTCGVVPFDSWFSRTRIEFTLPKSLTEIAGITFNKTTGLKIDKTKLPDLFLKIKDQFSWGNAVRNKNNKRSMSDDERKELEEILKQLNKSALNSGIIPPKSEAEKKDVSFKANPNKEPKTKDSQKKARIIERKVFNVKFENLGNSGVFWRLAYENNLFTIYINDAHTFYRMIYSQMDKVSKYHLLNLLASMAFTQYRTAELGVNVNDDYFWDTYWGDVSLQLRKIMNN